MKTALKNLAVWSSEFKESFLMALGAVVAHKLRSVLTLLGVLVGVFSIILVMTVMRAMREDIESNMSDLGSLTFMVQTWPQLHFMSPSDRMKYWRRKDITMDEGMGVVKRATLPASIGLELQFRSREMVSRFGKTGPNAELYGENPGSFLAKNWVVQEGRALNESDLERERDVCVLGGALAKDLFPNVSPVGERVQCDGVGYLVVGVLEPKGQREGGAQDYMALTPLTTGWTRYYNRRWEDLTVYVQVRSPDDYDDTVEEVRGIMRLLRKVPPGEEDDFEITSPASMMAQMQAFTFKVRLGITVVSSIALLAAGIGIMNIMLVSVTERTREIGVRRAIGARKRNIMAQFIVEAILLCELGGALGVVLGVAGGDIAGHYLKLRPVIPFDWVAIGLGICSLVGIIFGAYPAHRAANLDPIESLRYE